MPLRLTWDDGRRVLCFKPTTWRWLCVSSWWTARFGSVRFSSVRHKRYNHSKWITIRFIISNYLCDWQRIRIDLNFSCIALNFNMIFLSFEYSTIFSIWCLNNWQLHAYSYDFRQLNFALYWNYIKQMSKSRARISFCWAIHSRCLSLGIITWNRNCLFYRAAIQNVALMLMNEFICCCCCCCNIIAAAFFSLIICCSSFNKRIENCVIEINSYNAFAMNHETLFVMLSIKKQFSVYSFKSVFFAVRWVISRTIVLLASKIGRKYIGE